MRSAYQLLALLLTINTVEGQRADLKYQERGGYSEGIRSDLSTGLKLDLISASIHNPVNEASGILPATFKAQFFLPDSRPAFLSVRETTPRYFYWLSDVSSSLGARNSGSNFHGQRAK